MNNGAIILAFSLGVAVGAVTSWRLLKTKYERIAQEEIDSVREYYSRAGNEQEQELEVHVKEGPITVPKEVYDEILKVSKYKNRHLEEEEDMKDKPVVIPPDELGEEEDYEILSFTFYNDQVLTDDADEPMEEDEIEDTVGTRSLTCFGEYEDDSVFVRNDKLKCYYEILFDSRNYSDIERR